MITLIWHSSAESAWETDWIEHLFRKVPHQTIRDYAQTQSIDRSFIIYNSSVNNDKYIKDLHVKGFKFGLIHLSDEWDRDSTANYGLADVVLRNYYKNLGPKVINFPLGWMKTFPYQLTPNTVSRRLYTWGFSGHVDKTTRPEMAKHMSTVPNGKHYFKKCGENWGPFEGHALNPTEMAELYNNCLFVPCPQGNYSIDSFRVCEALQAGSLPIVERSDYWEKLYGIDHPLVQIDNWSQAPDLIKNLLNDPMALEQKRSNAYDWWVKYCDSLADKITGLL